MMVLFTSESGWDFWLNFKMVILNVLSRFPSILAVLLIQIYASEHMAFPFKVYYGTHKRAL